jgi:hypothetical protein
MRAQPPRSHDRTSQRDISDVKLRIFALLSLTLLAGCSHRGEILDDLGIYAVRSACPVAGIPAGTGDITLFDGIGARDSRSIDVTATMTDLRATCQETGTDVVSTVTFTVTGLRRDAGPARQVVLPYFDVAMRGDGTVSAKQIGSAALNFAAGDIHSYTRVQASIRVNRGAATLPEAARTALTKPRKTGDPDAAVDPMSDPEVAKAVAAATFEHLVGFQLTQEQLRYNVTR